MGVKGGGLLASAWAGLAGVHLALSAVAPRNVFADPLLPFWAPVAILATELALLAVVAAMLAAPFRLLSRLRARPLAVAGRCLLGIAVLVALAVSWASFWLSGRFLDAQGLEFIGSNFSPTFRYAAQMQPFLLYGLPWLLAGAAIAAGELFPRWLQRRDPARLERFVRGTAWAAGLCALFALAGEVVHRFGRGEVTDPTAGISYSPRELYRLRRAERAGPVTHLVAQLWPRWDGLEDALPAPDRFPLVRRRVQPLEAYVAGIDAARFRRWNVVVVLVDSLRPDQLRDYGCPRDVMPTVNSVAGESRVYLDCYSQASHTDYAAPCVFSSHYPLRAREIYRYPKEPTYPRVLVWDVLKALGYRTALFSSQNEEWGQMHHYLKTPGLDVFFHSKSAGGGAFAGTIDDAVTVGEALRWIDAGEAPFFLYLNLQTSHLPYAVPKDFTRRFGPKEIDFKITAGWFPEDKIEIVKNVYADSLSYVDAQVARLMERLRERGAWDRTVFVLCGDHGEGFYEHGMAAHANSVYEELMRVPLVIRAPGLVPARETRPAQLLDVPPTLFHLLGLPPHPAFQGESLVEPPASKERSRYLLTDTPWSTTLAIVRSGHKLIHDSRLGRCFLYDLVRDPGERRDVLSERPAVARDLKARLAAFRRAQLDYYENRFVHGREYPPRFDH